MQPQRLDGTRRGVYQLHAASAHPIRHIGRDELGRPIEDTLPTVDWKYFVTMSGCINKVPVRTCSVSAEDTDGMNYENMVTTEAVQAGWIPLSMCPYSTEYTHITRGPFVKPPAGEEQCDGAESGCSHMKALMKKRQHAAKERADAAAKLLTSKRDDELAAMRDGIVAGVGEAIVKAQEHLSAGKNRLRSGKGEE